MMALPLTARVFVAVAPLDMRGSFDALVLFPSGFDRLAEAG